MYALNKCIIQSVTVDHSYYIDNVELFQSVIILALSINTISLTGSIMWCTGCWHKWSCDNQPGQDDRGTQQEGVHSRHSWY